MKHEHMDNVKMKWEHGEEAVCVSCGHRNAMLATGNIGNVTFYECRDCHCIVAYHVNRNENYERSVIIGRSIGKTCRHCHHFVDTHARRELHGVDKVGYWCDNCGDYWGN